MAQMASKIWVLKQQVARSSLFQRSVPMTCSLSCFQGFIVIILSIVSFFNPRPCRERYTVSPTKHELLNFVIYRCHTILHCGPFFRSFVNLTRNIICIRYWKFKQTLKFYIHVKLKRERLPFQQTRTSREENTAVSLASTEGNNFQVPELTREQTDKMPGFRIWAYQTMY